MEELDDCRDEVKHVAWSKEKKKTSTVPKRCHVDVWRETCG